MQMIRNVLEAAIVAGLIGLPFAIYFIQMKP